MHKLIIHLVNPNSEIVEAAYIQIKGENTNIKRKAVQTVYEVQPNAEKKDLKDLEKNPFQMGWFCPQLSVEFTFFLILQYW